MQGTRAVLDVIGKTRGLIPAHAGNTDPGRYHHGSCRAHPRACGEHGGPIFSMGKLWGSSPRMRGTLIAFPVAVMGYRPPIRQIIDFALCIFAVVTACREAMVGP